MPVKTGIQYSTLDSGLRRNDNIIGDSSDFANWQSVRGCLRGAYCAVMPASLMIFA